MRKQLLITIFLLLSFIFLSSLAYSQPLVNKSFSLSGSLGDKYLVHVFNVDDVAKVIVNGREVGSVGYYQERSLTLRLI